MGKSEKNPETLNKCDPRRCMRGVAYCRYYVTLTKCHCAVISQSMNGSKMSQCYAACRACPATRVRAVGTPFDRPTGENHNATLSPDRSSRRRFSPRRCRRLPDQSSTSVRAPSLAWLSFPGVGAENAFFACDNGALSHESNFK